MKKRSMLEAEEVRIVVPSGDLKNVRIRNGSVKRQVPTIERF